MTDNILKATHMGKLTLGELEIPCFVLEDGTRVLSQRGIQKSLNMSSGGRGPNAHRMTTFVGQFDGKGAPDKDLVMRISNPIYFRTPKSLLAHGFEATLLVDICDAILAARNTAPLLKQQAHIAERAELLVRAFARVGIIALVDEATGYQEVRDRDALHRILEMYISPELLPWAKRFPDEFYHHIFRLRKWPTSPPTEKRPGFVGKLTNFLIYEKLPHGVLTELKERNPTVKPGRRKYRHHQYLTDDVGNPHLTRQLVAVITLMRISKSWTGFMGHFAEAFPTEGTQQYFQVDDKDLLDG